MTALRRYRRQVRSAFPLLPGVALSHACSQIVSARDRLAPSFAHGSHTPMAVPLALPAAIHRLAEGLPDRQPSGLARGLAEASCRRCRAIAVAAQGRLSPYAGLTCRLTPRAHRLSRAHRLPRVPRLARLASGLSALASAFRRSGPSGFLPAARVLQLLAAKRTVPHSELCTASLTQRFFYSDGPASFPRRGLSSPEP